MHLNGEVRRIPGSARNAAAFYAIAVGLAVLVALAAPVIGDGVLLLTMFTPAAAVAIMLAFLAPEGGLRAALVRLGLTRPGFGAWPLAIGAPVLIHAVGLAILSVAGLTVLALPAVGGQLPAVAAKLVVGLVLTTLFALAEEVGWRGYMLPRMGGFAPVPAMLLVGLLHGVWHLPLILGTDFYHAEGNRALVVPLFLVTLGLAGVFYGFLRLWTGSVWPVAIAHAAVNTAWGTSSAVSQPHSPLAVEYVGGESGLIMIGGLLILSAAIRRVVRRGDLRF